MVVVRIVDNNEIEYGVYIYENNENGEVFVQDDFHCHAEEDGFDTIFGTNDEQVTVQINPTKFIAKNIVDDIVSRRQGEIYDEDICDDFVNNYFEDIIMGYVRTMVDEMMNEHLEEDNLTIKGSDKMKYEAQCKHNCINCAGFETTGECNHGCFDCIHYDGGNCVNSSSNYYGCEGDVMAGDCHEWEGE